MLCCCGEAKKNERVAELAEWVGITTVNISILKNSKAKESRLSTLEAICEALNYQPGDTLEYKYPGNCDLFAI